VFLEYYLEPFVQKHDTEKLKNIILKTWNKMSKKGHEHALKINFSDSNFQLIKEALGL
jgi:exopolysaccharide biosynthesis protein